MNDQELYIAGLREMADFLEAHPEVTVSTTDIDNYCHVANVEDFCKLMQVLPSPSIDDLRSHEIFYINQKFGPVTLRYIQKKKGIFQPRIVDGEVKWEAPEVAQFSMEGATNGR